MEKRASVTAESIELPQGDVEEIDFAVSFWDEAESLIKEAEQINRAMIVPAVSELRYGGRKLIDYLAALRRKDEKSRKTHFEDFVQCCIRARHDAIDSMASFITLYLEELESAVDADIIEIVCPNYIEAKRALFEVAALVAESRQDRERRNTIYSEIRTEFVGKLIQDYRNISESRSKIFELQAKRDRSQNLASWATAASISFLALALLVLAF